MARLAFIFFAFQSLAGCAWIDNAPIEMKLPGRTAETYPCIAGNLGKEFRDAMPVVNRGNTAESVEIEVNAPRGGMLAFVTVDPLPSGDSHVTIYNGELYWPRRTTSGVFPDVARDNWHRAERAVLACTKQTA
jgi:hypothetical protein